MTPGTTTLTPQPAPAAAAAQSPTTTAAALPQPMMPPSSLFLSFLAAESANVLCVLLVDDKQAFGATKAVVELALLSASTVAMLNLIYADCCVVVSSRVVRFMGE